MGYLEEGRVVRGLLGDYHVERRLAKSRHHTLFTARVASTTGPGLRRSGETVLLKELHATDIREWSDIERLRTEARLLEDLRHARVPEFIELFATDGDSAEAADRFTERFVRADDGRVGEPIASSGRLPSLILARTFVPGESAEEAALRGRPFTPTQLEELMRDLLGLLVSLHGMVPEIVHGEIDASRVILDATSRAHLVGFGGGALRRKRAMAQADRAIEPARPIDDARAIARVVERLVGDGGLAKSRLSERALAVLRGLRPSGSVTSASAALAMLAEPPPPSALRRIGRSKALRFATLAVASISAHGLILGAVVRSQSKKAQPAAPGGVAAHPGPKTPLPPPPIPSPPPPPAPQPSPPLVLWTGHVLESTGVKLAKGVECVMTAAIEQASGHTSCAVSLTCGGEVILDHDDAKNCEVVEQQIAGSVLQYRMKATTVAEENHRSFRIDHGSAVVIDDENTFVRVQLAPASNPRPHADRRLQSQALVFAETNEYAGTSVTASGNANVHTGDACTLRFKPRNDEVDKNCDVRVECRGNVIYERIGAECETTPSGREAVFRDDLESVFDGDASFLWEDHLLTLDDFTSTGRQRVQIYIPVEKP